MIVVLSDVVECAIANIAGCCGATRSDRLGGQDKKPHIAARSVGCFACAFWSFLHIVHHECDVRLVDLSSDFSADRTSRVRMP